MTNPSSRLHGDLNSRQRRQKTKLEKKDSSLSDSSNSDEKKESDCGSASSMHTVSNSWQQENSVGGDMKGTNDFVTNDGSDLGGVEPQSRPNSSTFLSPEQDVPQTPRHLDHHGSSVSTNGLHHRHHNFQSQQSPSGNTAAQQSFHQQTSSPNNTWRRRFHHHHTRRRKWTVMQAFRSMLLAGATFYFFVMLRGMFMLMEQRDGNDTEPSHGRLSDYFPNLPAGYVSHPAIQGYLRSGSISIESLAPFVHKATNDNPQDVKRVLKQRLADRRQRTRPPSAQPPASSIQNYDIVPSEQRQEQTTSHRSQAAFRLAGATQLCGEHARRARANNPEAFLEKDALMDTDAKVLITGIISNPLAFHLALTLKKRCGVEVLIGIDPLLHNSIENRIQHVEQMAILSSNAPKMQPILVPLLGLDPRVKKSKKDTSIENPTMLELSGELNLLNFEPTHIVHLSAATYQNPVSINVPQSPMAPKRPLTPYQTSEDDSYDPALFQVRSSMTAMEQVLASMVSNTDVMDSAPHLTYASATTRRSSKSSEDVVLTHSKLADEVLADTYHALFGAYSVGVRYPPNAIYGPWGTQTNVHRLLQEAINGNFTAFDKRLGEQDFIYVQDAVDAMIGAMQYRESAPTHFDLKCSPAVSFSKVASMAEALLSSRVTSTVEKLPGSEEQSERTLKKLGWKPNTSLRDGLLKTMAWIVDKSSPYGPAPNRGAIALPSPTSAPMGSGDALLLANSVSTCSADEIGCHAGPTYLPCVSECSIKAQCRESIFDPVQQLTREMTEGCDAVLYTQSLGRNVEDLQLQSQFEEDVEPAICNLAFVAQMSPLVNAVIEKIPKAELERLGVPAISPFDEKLKKLNGRLLYRGWILIWVDLIDPVSLADSSLMKLSPGRMFAADVLYAVFVEENFTVSPTTDDVRFLISQMDRGATKSRGVWRMVKKDENSKPKKVKFTIAAQPEKRSSILVSQLKFKISDRGRIPQDTRISIMDAVRFMRFEIGSDPTKQKESSAIKRQKDFYRRIPAFINGKDLRDNFEPIYKYELKQWVRTRWVVHDLTLEESRELRCDWYQEHVQWGSEIDQLSFAAVMAQRILDRRMSLMEQDDRSKHKTPEINELKDVTDHSEWFAMATEHNKLHILQNAHVPGVQEVTGADPKDDIDEEGTEDGPDVPAGSGYNNPEKRPEVGLYVRIISDRIMSLSRKAWARYRNEIAQAAKPERL